MKEQSQSQENTRQKSQTGQKNFESESKRKFLAFAEKMKEEPTQELAEYYLYGDYGSVEAAEEPVPKWFWELPVKAPDEDLDDEDEEE